MDILERDKQWSCQGCNNSFDREVIFCQLCQQFRPLEMFKNLLHDPFNVSDFELNFIENRRKLEKKLILDKDLESQDPEEDEDIDKEEIPKKKLWFMISGDWLF